jgi:hypothetical protein
LAVPFAAAGAILVIVWTRIARSGVQTYGDDGAPWIEHEARMLVLETFQLRHELRPLAFFRELDGYFPPLMHLLTTPLAALGGHTDHAAARTAILWLFLLAWAVGAVTWQLGRDRSVAAAAATGTLLLPAAHAFATRYYYDLPFTAGRWRPGTDDRSPGGCSRRCCGSSPTS